MLPKPLVTMQIAALPYNTPKKHSPKPNNNMMKSRRYTMNYAPQLPN
jgi:hypothetical protein